MGHQFDLWKLPHEFTLLFGLSGITARWDYNSRPLPSNATFKRVDDSLNMENYDFALLHFDENILDPIVLSNGVLSPCWGDQFKHLMENFNGPKVAICHGVPYYKGACDPGYTGSDLGEIVESRRQELVGYLGDTPVVCNSFQAHKEWGFRNSRVIWQGFDPLNYPPCDAEADRILTVIGQIKKRPYYRGYELYKAVMDRIDWSGADFLGDQLPNAVERKANAEDDYPDANAYGRANYRTYVDVLRNHGIYFNPTYMSPMPRTRGEALMCGLALVTTSPHDSDLFIESGYNGFVSDSIDDLVEILTELKTNHPLRRTIGRRGRQTALDIFHVNRFLRDWRKTLEVVLDRGRFPAPWSKPPELDLRNLAVPDGGNLECEISSPQLVQKARAFKGVLYVYGQEPSSGTHRYRVDHAVKSLRKVGLQTDCIHIRDITAESLGFLALGQYDAIICHRLADHRRLEALCEEAKRRGVLLVYDIDDLLFRVELSDFFVRLGRETKAKADRDVSLHRAAIQRFDHATCTTPTLKALLEEQGVRHVEIVPNVASDDMATMSEAAAASVENGAARRDRIVIGYSSGSKTHVFDFAIVVPSLKRVMKRFAHVELHLLGEIDVPRKLEEFGDRIVRKKLVSWRLLPPLLAEFDISLAPLERNVFCESKSALKYFEAGYVRVPTVATPTQPFQDAITHGVNGMLAQAEEDWDRCLESLIQDEKLRSKLGAFAYEDSRERYSLDVMASEILECLGKWLPRSKYPNQSADLAQN